MATPSFLLLENCSSFSNSNFSIVFSRFLTCLSAAYLISLSSRSTTGMLLSVIRLVFTTASYQRFFILRLRFILCRIVGIFTEENFARDVQLYKSIMNVKWLSFQECSSIAVPKHVRRPSPLQKNSFPDKAICHV